MLSPTKIIITIEKKFNDELSFNGSKIFLDTSFNPEWNVIPYGIVHSVPLRDLDVDGFVCNVEVGDKLYFNYNVVMDDSNLIEHDGQEYWLVDYYMALAVSRDGVIIPVGEHILIEPIVEEVTHDFLIIPELAKKIVTDRGKVFASNDPEIPVGSVVEFDPVGKFENEIDGHKLFVMFNNNIYYLWNSKS